MSYDLNNPDANQSGSIGEAIEQRLVKKRIRPPKVPLPQSTHSVCEAAAILGLSTKTVIRKFRNIAGVLNHGTKKAGKKQSRSRLTIPKKVMEKYLADHGIV